MESHEKVCLPSALSASAFAVLVKGWATVAVVSAALFANFPTFLRKPWADAEPHTPIITPKSNDFKIIVFFIRALK
ncbi:MAG: hypothetical protein ACOCO5_06955 [Segatella copri]